jgi:hypothetical protein
VLSRWQGWVAAAVPTVVTWVLVILDLTDEGMRRWWAAHALTTDTVAGLLVLLITVLVVDQVVRLRQIKDRARAVGVQAAIMMTQATRTTQAVSQAVSQAAAGSGDGNADSVSDEFRTYIMMLLAVAPVLIDAKASRAFLEQAQRLGGEMARALTVTAKAPEKKDTWTKRLNDALQGLKAASTPLLQNLDPEMRAAVSGDNIGTP